MWFYRRFFAKTSYNFYMKITYFVKKIEVFLLGARSWKTFWGNFLILPQFHFFLSQKNVFLQGPKSSLGTTFFWVSIFQAKLPAVLWLFLCTPGETSALFPDFEEFVLKPSTKSDINIDLCETCFIELLLQFKMKFVHL